MQNILVYPFLLVIKFFSSHFFLIHSDIWGPSTIPNTSGSRWFVPNIDDCTRVYWIYLLKNKSDVSHIFPTFFTMVQNQFGTKIKKIRSDNAFDYFNQIMSHWFQKEGIVHGVVKRKNCHLLKCIHVLLFQQNGSKSYWGEAVLTLTYAINRIPSRVLGFKSPLETFSQLYPDIRSSFNFAP